MTAHRTFLNNEFKKYSYTNILFSNAPLNPAYRQQRTTKTSNLRSSVLSVQKLLKVSSKQFEVIMTAFLHILRHFIGFLLLLTGAVLSTLYGVPLGFVYFLPVIIFLLLITFSAWPLCPIRNALVVWGLRPYLGIRHWALVTFCASDAHIMQLNTKWLLVWFSQKGPGNSDGLVNRVFQFRPLAGIVLQHLLLLTGVIPE